MIIAVLGEKGGTGKTTLAVHFAGWRAMTGRNVMLLDTDRQRSASFWVEARTEQDLPVPSSVQIFDNTGRLTKTLRDYSKRFEDVVVDIGSGNRSAIQHVLEIAEFAILPVQPNGMDFWTIGLVDQIAAVAMQKNSKLQIQAVLNKASTHPSNRDVEDAIVSLEQCAYIGVSKAVIRERSSIRRSIPGGLLVNEYSPKDHKGISEISHVYKTVFSEEPPLNSDASMNGR